MELHQLRCFLAVADELHFGRAAQRPRMPPSALGRHIHLLEESLGRPLFARTTRSVALTEDGSVLVGEARAVIAQVEAIAEHFRDKRSVRSTRRFRIGVIDSAAAGLVPPLFADIRAAHPEIAIQLQEDKTIRMLPKILSGALDLAFVRPPERPDKRLEFKPILEESAVVALPERHLLARRKFVVFSDIAGQALIVPDRRSRPHSYNLTMKLFEAGGVKPQIAEVADEKQTIVGLVAAGLGVAIVPRWTERIKIAGVRFVPLKVPEATVVGRLPLAAVWLRGSRDPVRAAILEVLDAHLESYAKLT